MNVTLIRPGVDLSGPHTRLSQEQGSIFTQGCQNVGQGRGVGGGVFSYLLLLHCPPLTHTQEHLHESWFGSGTWTQFRQRCSLLVSTLAFVRNSALIALINLCRLMTSPTPTDLFFYAGDERWLIRRGDDIFLHLIWISHKYRQVWNSSTYLLLFVFLLQPRKVVI